MQIECKHQYNRKNRFNERWCEDCGIRIEEFCVVKRSILPLESYYAKKKIEHQEPTTKGGAMKYIFLEALEVIGKTKKRIKRSDENLIWYSLVYINNKDKTPLLMSDHKTFSWPTLEEQKAKIWEVEPEEIYI